MELSEILSLFSKETARLAKAQAFLKKEIAQLREKLEASHETMRSLFTHFADGLIYINDSRMIEFFNEKASLLIGLTVEPPQNFHDVFSDTFFGFSINEMLADKKGALRLFLSLSSEAQLEVFATPIRGKKGGLLLLIKDNVGKSTSYEKSVSCQSEFKAISDVLGSLAHEIRNPLTAIEGFATLIAFDKDKEARKKASAILDATRLIFRLIDDALSFCEAPRIKLAKADLERITQDAIDHFEAASQLKEKVSLKKAGSYFLTYADSALIKLALFNLMKNGMEASSEGSSLNIELREEEESIILDIIDQGHGIEPKALQKLFMPSFTTKERGHGLGLAETYKAITAQGGSLEVQSEIGRGSRFTIKLPRYNAS